MGIFGASILPSAAIRGVLADPKHPAISAVRGPEGAGPMTGDYPYAVPAMPAYKSPGVARSIVGSIGDALQQFGGGQPTFGPEMQRQRQMAMQAQMAQQQRAQEFADQTRLYDYKAAHPAPQQPDEFTRTIIAAGIDPASPQGQAMYRDRATNLANPLQGVPVTNPDGSQELRFIRPGQMGGQPQPQALGATLPQGWTVGGASPQGGATFP